MERFFELTAVHDELSSALAAHQRALVGLDLSLARELFSRFDRMLREHVRVEETYVLPLYEALVPGASDARIYRAEHRRLEAFLAELRDRIEAALALPDPRGAIVAALDRECVFKHVIEHHDLRERRALYPCLDRLTTKEDRGSVLAALERGLPLPAGWRASPVPPPPEAWRSVTDVRVGLFLVALKLASGAVGLAPAPPASEAEPDHDPDAIIGRDALDLAESGKNGPPLARAIARAALEALSGTRRAPAPERLLWLVTRGARPDQLGRIGAA